MIIDEINCDFNKDVPICNDQYELKNYENYFYLYEYSDEITLITDNKQFPNILNYVKTGLLTKEEMIQALLYK